MTAVAHRILKSFSLVVTDRRWAALLSSMALGFGIFAGVAIGPDAAGTLASAPLIVEVPPPQEEEPVQTEARGGEAPVLAGPAPAGEGAGGGAPIAALPAPPPPEPAPEEAPPPEEPAPAQPEEEGEEELEETVPLEGVVVHGNPAAGSYTIAIKGGELISIHAAKLPTLGSELKFSAARLENGTFEATEKPKSVGHTTRVSFRGVVTFVEPNPAAPAYTISGRGSSILVRVRPDPTGAAPTLPAINSSATVTASIEKASAASALQPPPVTEAIGTAPPAPTCAPPPGQPQLKSFQPTADLWQEEIKVEAEPATYIDLAGMISAICQSTGQVLLSADDTRASGHDLLLTVGPKIKASKLTVGESFLATATVEPDGTLTLAGVTSDEKSKGADDAKSAQGDLKR